jgi:hypothetical protein
MTARLATLAPLESEDVSVAARLSNESGRRAGEDADYDVTGQSRVRRSGRSSATELNVLLGQVEHFTKCRDRVSEGDLSTRGASLGIML